MDIIEFTINGWPLARVGEEPRIRDIDLAKKLDYKRHRKIRELIERLAARGELAISDTPNSSEILRRPTVGRQPVGPNGGGERAFEVVEYWLTRAQALKVSAKSDTVPADALLDEMIHVFELALDGKLPGQSQAIGILDQNIIRALLAEHLEPIKRELVLVRHENAELRTSNVELKNTIKEIRDGTIATATATELETIAELVKELSARRRAVGDNLWRAMNIRQQMAKICKWGARPGDRSECMPSASVPSAMGWLKYEIDKLKEADRVARKALREELRMKEESRQTKLDFN
jgi:hypothetical protein